MLKKGLKGRLDKVFSKFIKRRDDWTCRRCGLRNKPDSNYYDPAHIKGRRIDSLRWDDENVFGLCRSCHQFMDGHPLKKRDWYISQFGGENWDRLVQKSNRVSHFKNWELEEMIQYFKVMTEEK